MLGIAFEETTKLRNTADEALSLLNKSSRMPHNPFLQPVSQQVLFVILDDFCANVRVAANMLSNKSGIAMFDVESAKAAAAAMDGIEMSFPYQKSEENIRSAFEEKWAEADGALRLLQKTPEKEGLAQDAMNALRNLYIVSKAAPVAYEMATPYLAKQDMIFKPA